MLETVLLIVKGIILLNQTKFHGKRTIIKEMKKERQGKERLKTQKNRKER